MTVVRRHPDWVKVRAPRGPEVTETRRIVRALRLHTVCEEALCPNLGECWGQRTATFMLMGDVCTRNCGYCGVAHGRPQPLDPSEPTRVAAAAAQLGLRHVVVTSVNRDDLPDGGAGHFAATVRAIRDSLPTCRIEVLIPDFKGSEAALYRVVDAPIDVLNHNMETVPRLYKHARPGAKYEGSLALLGAAKGRRAAVRTKTGLMMGMGEEPEEVLAVLRDVAAAGCNILTIGQYLQPSRDHLPVVRYVHPDEFAEVRQAALAMGFDHVESGPLVRSSYHAWAHVE